MTPCHSPSRRHLLELLLSGVATCIWSSTGRSNFTGADDLERARQLLIALFSDRRRVLAIAAAYLGSLSRERAAPAALTRAILGHMSISLAAGLTVPAIRRIIAERIQLDFLHDNIVCIDGWMLSKTEAAPRRDTDEFRCLTNSTPTIIGATATDARKKPASWYAECLTVVELIAWISKDWWPRAWRRRWASYGRAGWQRSAQADTGRFDA